MTVAVDTPGDDVLMARAAAGQETAFGELVERYERRVRGFCRMMVQDDALAYDLAQDVFLKIWKRRAHYRGQGRFKEFVFTVARNECRSALRRRTLFEWLGLSAQAEHSAELHADDAPDERLQVIAAALLRLPERFRVPLTLRFVEELSYAEIARVIGRTESAARSRVFYGLKELASSLAAGVSS